MIFNKEKFLTENAFTTAKIVRDIVRPYIKFKDVTKYLKFSIRFSKLLTWLTLCTIDFPDKKFNKFLQYELNPHEVFRNKLPLIWLLNMKGRYRRVLTKSPANNPEINSLFNLIFLNRNTKKSRVDKKTDSKW